MALKFLNMSQKELAEIAIANHLYVDGWNIINHYLEIVLNKKLKCKRYICVMFEGDKAIGACTISTDTKQIAVFVAKSIRSKGVGSKLVAQALKETKMKRHQVFAGNGIDGSIDFFKKNKILSFDAAQIPLTQQQVNDYIAKKKTYAQLLKEFMIQEYQKEFGVVAV